MKKLAVLGIVVLGAMGLACSAPPPGPNIVLVSIDSLRPDHLHTYGYPRLTSPNIDRLAAEGVVFENAFSNTTWTLPAHVALLTGLNGERLGVASHSDRLEEDAVLIAERLKEKGFHTAAFVSSPFLHSSFGFEQGFDHYDDWTIGIQSHRESHSLITGPSLHSSIVRWLDADLREPFFLFVHYWDVHYDYQPPAPYDEKFDPDYTGEVHGYNFELGQQVHSGMNPRDLEHVIALYNGEIGFTDEIVGRLFDELKQRGLYDQSVVIVTADHGDEFFEHGAKGHKKNLFDTTLRVPLVLKLPHNEARGLRKSASVGLVDVVPTVLDLIGEESPLALDGRSLLPMIRGEPPSGEHAYFAELEGRLRAIRSGRFKLIRGDGIPAQLFDVGRDPAETTDLAATAPARVLELEGLLDAYSRNVETAQRLRNGEPIPHSPDIEEVLRSLGYIR